jgi:hypothetical protein
MKIFGIPPPLRKPYLWAKYQDKRRQNQGVSLTVCVDEDLRFPPQLDHPLTVRCFLYACYGNP